MRFEVKVEKKIRTTFMDRLMDAPYWVSIEVFDESNERWAIDRGHFHVRKAKNVDKKVQRWIASWMRQHEKKRTYMVKHDN